MVACAAGVKCARGQRDDGSKCLLMMSVGTWDIVCSPSDFNALPFGVFLIELKSVSDGIGYCLDMDVQKKPADLRVQR